MTELSSSALAWAAVIWLLASALITFSTWKVARGKMESPAVILVSSALLAFFPPLNLILLAVLSLIGRRTPP